MNEYNEYNAIIYYKDSKKGVTTCPISYKGDLEEVMQKQCQNIVNGRIVAFNNEIFNFDEIYKIKFEIVKESGKDE